MDTGQTLAFISLIQEKPELWQKVNKDFMNREVRTKIFCEIADMLGVTEDTCKKKLKCLKDKMRMIVSKLPRDKAGQLDFDSAEHHVRWPFYKSMLFMVDEFLGKEATGGSFSHDLQTLKEESLSSMGQDSDGESLLSLPLDRLDPEPSADTEMAFAGPHNLREPPAKKARTSENFASLEKINYLKTLFSNEKNETKDEWQTFCQAIAFDLRKLEDPFLIMRAKNDIYAIVNNAVLEQLRQSKHPAATANENS